MTPTARRAIPRKALATADSGDAKIRVALIDDHPMVVDGLLAGLRSTNLIEVVVVAASAVAASEILHRQDVDVVLLDVRLEGGNGLEVLARRGARQKPYVLILSSFNSNQYVAVATRFGASGFLLKTAPIAQLIHAIRIVAAGGTVFTEAQLGTPLVSLTPRERDVVALTMQGMTNKEIADRLGTSKKAVEQHLSGVFLREAIRGGRVELALRAAAEGWLDIDPMTTTPDHPRRVERPKSDRSIT